MNRVDDKRSAIDLKHGAYNTILTCSIHKLVARRIDTFGSTISLVRMMRVLYAL